MGKKFQGEVIGICSGHRLNLALCQKIMRETEHDSFSETHAGY